MTNHLTDEQIEELLGRPDQGHPHLSRCAACSERLNDAAAIRRRLRQAFAPVHADTQCRQQVVAGIRGAHRRMRPGRVWPALKNLGPGLAAAAAVVAVAFSLMFYFLPAKQASAATAELAQIHQANMMPHAELHGSSDPAHVAEYFRRELGFEPAMPRLGAGMALRGCCVAHFRNRPVGSYVMETDRGVMSVIVLRDSPDSLDLPGETTYRGRAYRVGAFARNKMVAARINGYTYIAIGETDVPWLVELLESLLDEARA